MNDRSTTGRTPWDVLSEILSSSGFWLIPVMLIIAIAAVAWVHYQTPPGGSVQIFGISLYNRTPERAIPELKPSVEISAPPLDKPKFDKESGHLDG